MFIQLSFYGFLINVNVIAFFNLNKIFQLITQVQTRIQFYEYIFRCLHLMTHIILHVLYKNGLKHITYM